MHTSKKAFIVAAIFTLPVLTAPQLTWAAPVLPDTHGAVKNQLPKNEARVENDLPGEPADQSTKSFTLQKLTVDRENLQVNEAALNEIAENYVGRLVTMNDLNKAIGEVTMYCRTHGYPAAAAYLPSQTTGDGALVIKILPGRYGKVKLDNQSGIKDRQAESYLRGLKSGDIIHAEKLETALYNLSNLGGVQAAGVLSPGAGIGTSDVTVKLTKGKKNTAIVYAENYGSASSGRYRYGVQDTIQNLSGRGDKLSLGALVSNHDLRNGAVSYELPAGPSGTMVGISYSHLDYDLGGAFSSLGANGHADTYAIYGKTPFYVTANRSLYANYGYNYRKLRDDLDSFSQSSRKHSHSFFVGVSGQNRKGKAVVQYDLNICHGTLGMDSDDARLQNTMAATEGAYTKGVVNVQYVQGFDQRWDLLVKGQAQLASRNLDSSEDIYLGGANGVRAYPQGEASGDAGYTGTAELRYQTGVPGLVLSTYLDAGHVQLSKDSSSGSETLKGYGFAVSYTKPGDWFARLDYARRIGLGDKLSTDAQSRQRMWFMAGKIW